MKVFSLGKTWSVRGVVAEGSMLGGRDPIGGEKGELMGQVGIGPRRGARLGKGERQTSVSP